jgi:hypothetical protein
MKKVVGLGIVALLCCATQGRAADTFEDLVKESIKSMKQLVEVLETVKDEASAKTAKPKLEKMGKDMQALQARAKKLGEPSKEDKEKLEKKYKPELESLSKKLIGELLRIQGNPETAKVLKDVDFLGRKKKTEPAKDAPKKDAGEKKDK